MHIPAHVIDPATSIATGIAATAALGYAAYRVRRESVRPSAGAVGATSACVFAAQMLNFPISSHVSGHVLGGVAAVLVLGPWAGMIAMAAVLVVQCLLFQDGGLDALGANILNMSILACGLGALCQQAIARRLPSTAGQVVGAGVSAWLMVVAAAGACALELSAGGSTPLATILPTMLFHHAIIGMGEAAVTGLVALLLIAASRRVATAPFMPMSAGSFARGALVGLLAVALVVACYGSTWASALPDGLEASLESAGVPSSEAVACCEFTTSTFGIAAGVLASFLIAALGCISGKSRAGSTSEMNTAPPL